MSRDPVPFRAPSEPDPVRDYPPQQYAAGKKAIWEAGKLVSSRVGLVRGVKALFKLNQVKGTDCPGCAWPDPDDDRSSLGEYCENGVKAIAEEATRKSIGRKFFKKHSIQELSVFTDFELGQLGRIKEPLILEPGRNHYTAIEWQQAFELIGSSLRELNSPNEAVFYTSGRTSNEAAFMYQLMARQFGTNNLPDCSNMCHESSGVALAETLGIGKGSVTLQDFYETDLILIMGQNPGTNHPRMLTALEKAKSKGAKVITANPIPEAGLIGFQNPQTLSGLSGKTTAISDLYLPVKVNGDIAMLKAIMLQLWKEEQQHPGEVFDQDFIRSRTRGYQDFLKKLEQQSLSSLYQESGLSADQIAEAAQVIQNNPKMIICWAMGLTQHENAVATIQEIVNLLLLKGSIGKPGAGSCPVRGHSNVQGDRTMGIWEKSPPWIDKLANVFDFSPPSQEGYNTVEAIKAMHQGRVKVFIGLGGNFHSAAPDTDYTSEALQACDLTVQISTKLNRSHLVTGKTALILPCLSRTDLDRQDGGLQKVSVENSMGVVHSSQGYLKPVSTMLKSEPAIVAGIACCTLKAPSTIWQDWVSDYDKIRDSIAEVIPGFEHYNQKLEQPGGFLLPNVARAGQFINGFARFTPVDLPDNRLAEGQYMLMTIRSHDQFNTTIYGLDDRYRGIINGRRVLFMHPQDIEDAGLKAGSWVDVYSEYEGRQRTVYNFKLVAYPITRGNLATYFPEANPLVPVTLTARKSHTPVSKSIRVRIRAAQG